MLRFLNPGESHFKVDIDNIKKQLESRQKLYTRGICIRLGNDIIKVKYAVRGKKTNKALICAKIKNKYCENWEEIMNIISTYDEKKYMPNLEYGYVNVALKYNFNYIRNFIEIVNIKETSIRVVICVICMELLANFSVKIVSRVVKMGNIQDIAMVNIEDNSLINLIENSYISYYCKEVDKKMIKKIKETKSLGDTLRGERKIIVFNIPCGLKSCQASTLRGSLVNNSIILENDGVKRLTNYAGGIEVGITNGMPIVGNVYIKSNPNIKIGIDAVDINENKTVNGYKGFYICVLPALGVICESVLAFEITKAFLQKFSGDCIEYIKNSYDFYISRIVRG